MSPPVKRDSLSPATGASLLQRMPSSESLNAHPLLSPTSSSPSTPAQSNQDATATTPPRYVPYTPRHRPPASSATTSMTTHVPTAAAPHRHLEGGATSKLQLQSLKAAAQGIGLGNGTVGWAMLEKLVDVETGGEWDDIWTILTTAKPTLLLPLEPFSGELITPELIKDHLAFCNAPSSSPSPLITLSGLRGSITDSVLTFRSTLPLSSKPFLDLSKPELQASALASLPPLPSSEHSTTTPLPSFALPASASLPLPPRPQSSKPPLPPRPGTSSSAPPRPQAASRISNPFASLFGRPPASSNASILSTSPSQSSLQAEEPQGVGSVDIYAFSLGKKITKNSVGKELSKVIKEEIKAMLLGCPIWVVDRVLDFTGPLHPVPRTSKRIEIRQISSMAQSDSARPKAPSVLPPSTQAPPDPSSLADALQSFYKSIEDDFRAVSLGSPFTGWKRAERRPVNYGQDDSSVTEKESEDGREDVKEIQEEAINEAKIRDVLERVESTICTTFYDRTFRPLAGDDISHDDALANRIAALSLLDLSLEHLGVEMPNDAAKKGVDDVVKACGATLQELEDPRHRSPREKCALLVKAHQNIVDGLSRLPQLRLKPENDVVGQDQDEKTPRASSFEKEATQEVLGRPSSASPSPSTKVLLSGDLDATPAKTASENLSLIPSTEPALTTEVAPYSIPQTSDFHASGRLSSESAGPSSTETSRPPLPPRSSSPTPISGDLLFPLLIFSVVKANPTSLVSHLLYTQRFRSRSVGGQESYCLINLMAVVEFLENVDMSALGLGDSERVMSTADLTPIPLAHGSMDPSTSPSSPLSSRLGKRMNQQVEELAGLAGSANKVITGVVDSSFGVLRGFLASTPDLSTPQTDVQNAAPWNNVRPGFGMLRRGSGFSIASVTASLPGAGRPKAPGSGLGEEGQQLVEVSSRPGSIRETEVESNNGSETSESHLESGEDSPQVEVPDRGDARSVRSFSSMMTKESRDRDRTAESKERLSLTDRLASMSTLSRSGTLPGEQAAAKASPPSSRPTSRPTSWLPPTTLAGQQADTPASGTSSPSRPKIRIPPPNKRFLECAEQDIRVGEVGELLREYRRMVQALHASGAFEDHT